MLFNMVNRKDIVKIQTQKVVHHEVKSKTSAKIISTENYITGEENLVVVKDVKNCNLILNSEVNNKITIKSLTNVTIKPDKNLIDEEWEEMLVERGACVQFFFVGDSWYIISSDGIKLM